MKGKDSELGRSMGALWKRYLQQGQQHQQGQGGQAHHVHPGDLQNLGVLGDHLHPGLEERICQKSPWEPSLTSRWQGVKGQDRRPSVMTLKIREETPPRQRCWGLSFSLDSGSFRFREQRNAHPLAHGSSAHWRVGVSP